MKTQIVAPKETKSFFEFNPLLGYIQGKSKFEVWVKMNADKDLLTLCSKYLDLKTGILEIPFKVNMNFKCNKLNILIKVNWRWLRNACPVYN